MSKFKIDDMKIPYHYLSLLALIWPSLLTEVYIYSNHSLVLVSVTNQSHWLSHSITLSYLKIFFCDEEMFSIYMSYMIAIYYMWLLNTWSISSFGEGFNFTIANPLQLKSIRPM